MKKFLVGGAVRDALMGVPCNDEDFVVVGATEQEMLDLGFKSAGAFFPVFLHPVTKDEYALARKEKKTGPGHTGFSVSFDPSVTLAEDLCRRDLTINAMARDLDTGEIFDPFNGQKDLKSKTLRHVSNAFKEDPLRVVRLARLFARFTDFEIAHETVLMAKEIVDSGEMDTLSNERFWAEMKKMFSQSEDPMRFFTALFSFGAMTKVKFFKDVFGTIAFFNYPAFMAHVISVDEDDRMDMFISLVASKNAEQAGVAFPSRITKLTKNMRTIRAMRELGTPKAEEEAVFKLLKGNRAFGPSPSIDDVFLAMSVAQMVGERFAVSREVLVSARWQAAQVSAEKYSHLSGADIGKAMDAERMKMIESAMKGLR